MVSQAGSRFPAVKISYMVLPESMMEIFNTIKTDYTQTCWNLIIIKDEGGGILVSQAGSRLYIESDGASHFRKG